MGSVGSGNNEKLRNTLSRIEDKIYDDQVETAAIIDSNGNVLVDKSEGAKDAVHFTKEELAMMNGNRLTHNHPSSSTFSMPDVNLFCNTGLKEIRAVGSDGNVFSLEKMETFNPDLINAYYSNEQIYKQFDLDPIWDDAYNKHERGEITQSELDAVADRLNNRLEAERRKWLRENASAYGVKYTESKR